jgi:GNAT superfamily N-acetyltransferase
VLRFARMDSLFTVRRATIDDAAVIARHRVGMFADIGILPDDLRGTLTDETLQYLRDAIPRGEYLGFLAATASDPGTVIAGAGVQRRRVLPHPLTRDGSRRIAHGNQAIVLNVFTEHEWRRQGLAALLMNHVLDWAVSVNLDTLVLHASDDGRSLYEKLGFVSTNEMRYTRLLRRETCSSS